MELVRDTAASNINTKVARDLQMKYCLIDNMNPEHFGDVEYFHFARCSFTRKGIAALAELLREPKKVRCSRIVVGAKNARAFLETICMAEHLSIENTLMETLDAVDLSGISGTVKSLSAPGNYCESVICKLLGCMPLLDTLCVGRPNFVPEIYDVCSELKHLTALSFEFIRIDSRASVLANHPTLRGVSFNKCSFADKGILAVLKAPVLEEMVSYNCTCYTIDLEEALLCAAYHSNLKRVAFSGLNTRLDIPFLAKLFSQPSSLDSLEVTLPLVLHVEPQLQLLEDALRQNLVIIDVGTRRFQGINAYVDRNKKNFERRNRSLLSLALCHLDSQTRIARRQHS